MRVFVLLLGMLVFMAEGCGKSETGSPKKSEQQAQSQEQPKPVKPVMTKLEVIREFSHDPEAYTQGLFYQDGFLYESTGHKGQSSLRKIDFQTGEVLKKVDIDDKYFSEGICLSEGKIHMLTWQSEKGFIFDFETFKQIGDFSYKGEGWGLECRGNELIKTDGTNMIKFLNKETFAETAELPVHYHADNLNLLNELELVGDTLFANIYMYDAIAKIDIFSGNIMEIIDCSELRRKITNPAGKREAFNGIAYIPETGNFILTGKYWDKYFEVKFTK
jgi:glutaminyl-peptide cyclotransferase